MVSHILLVEDEQKLARFVELELTSEGYSVSVAGDGMAGLIAARESKPDLILLDWEMPGISGLEVCRRLRSTGIQVPVILLTGRSAVADRVVGLDAGADDYLAKPFSIEELLARIRARLRSVKDEKETYKLSFEDIFIDRLTHEVHRGKRAIELTPKEFDLLVYLLNHSRQVVSKNAILERVWGYDFMGDSNIIEVYVRSLRLKLEKEGEKRLLHTIRGVGYILKTD
ncbi:MAG: response regulator transcription factor [Anaerolineae bacterium]|nr:response regulator transcription factor [Gloeobacterales cyanobacterium ES-bin-313]